MHEYSWTYIFKSRIFLRGIRAIERSEMKVSLSRVRVEIFFSTGGIKSGGDTHDKRRGSPSSPAAVLNACWSPGICTSCCDAPVAAAAPSICLRRCSGSRTPRVCRSPLCRPPASSPPGWVSLRARESTESNGNYTRLINSSSPSPSVPLSIRLA